MCHAQVDRPASRGTGAGSVRTRRADQADDEPRAERRHEEITTWRRCFRPVRHCARCASLQFPPPTTNLRRGHEIHPIDALVIRGDAVAAHERGQPATTPRGRTAGCSCAERICCGVGPIRQHARASSGALRSDGVLCAALRIPGHGAQPGTVPLLLAPAATDDSARGEGAQTDRELCMAKGACDSVEGVVRLCQFGGWQRDSRQGGSWKAFAHHGEVSAASPLYVFAQRMRTSRRTALW